MLSVTTDITIPTLAAKQSIYLTQMIINNKTQINKTFTIKAENALFYFIWLG
jgi:hypothetical protein